MRKVENIYDGRENPEWRGELVKLLSGVVYDYLRVEGLLRAEVRLTENAKRAVKKARRIAEQWEEWEEHTDNNPCSPKDANLY